MQWRLFIRTGLTLLTFALTSTLLSGCAGSGGSATATPRIAPSATAFVANATPAARATPNPLADTNANGQAALASIRELSVTIGPRVAGTPSEIQARDYLEATLRSYGYDVTAEPFPFDASTYLPARVDVGPTAIPGFAFTGSPAGRASGPLVIAGIGRPEDFPAGGARGAIALIERGELTFSEKVQNATAAGAAGVIVYNNESGSLLADLSGTATIPVVGIKQAAGQDLAARAAAGGLTASVSVTPPHGTAYNVIAKPQAVTQCATITGGHYDSVAVTGGADDNASGTATVLETARVIAARKEEGANCFVLFSGEEFGLLGSKAYVASLSAEHGTALRAMLNFDVVGLPVDLTLLGSPDLVDTARLAGEGVGVTGRAGGLPPGAASDHVSFINADIPAVMFYRDDPDIHTPTDEISRIDVASLRDDVRIAVATLERIAGR